MTKNIAHKQHPISSGFTASSTAEDVLAGIDLSGRNVLITGGHAGLGLETTRTLSRAGASVTVGSRNPERAAAALAGIERVEIGRLDLLDPASIDAFATRFVDSGRPLHILINNAGMPPRELVRDARGYEAQFATNHLGHFQLTLALLPSLRTAHGARVVNVTSGAQRFSDILWDDPNFQITEYSPRLAYAQSKTANVLFAVELDRRWAADGIRGYAAHPGVVIGTGLNSAAGEEAHRAEGLIDESGRPVIDPEHGKKTPQQGASTIVFAATSPLLTEIGGVYLKDNDISPLDDEPRPMSAIEPPSEVMSHSIDPRSAQRFWELSEQLLSAPMRFS
ncbi:NAD(P)-dependent dehydrogenase (short-subunit alcohol dehydrogenase family) [Tamaricihabitans halophyticus]|uniref:NAD(P)-dependent dehydrogenase (Short-subunit alcohol dehydrogenase family) n=1 Tax=Tamaricihabitans halophyticus TaxID=1262583 RepID=A0A4V2STB8_9PSEU|nr:SDR family NAD(P)-dependent oxidoreductase [Tamaricihabitans halophyticus]TCP50136.1 NAD(P)-dependent dehydrogenase (short-subunit alcohol dehydrogenase family) [Tamaricihabitans halophyticus]